MKLGVMPGMLCTLVLVLSSCGKSNEKPSAYPERAFTAPWSMDSDSLTRLKLKVNALILGDDLAEVVKTVGVPDTDHTVKKDEAVRILTYYVTRQRTDSPVESDKVVYIAFDQNGKVKGIYSNVEGISTRNWP
jgi:hypothetical protein